jgi:TolB-like protein
VHAPFPAYRGEDPYVFVCYAHEDAGVVYPELQRLQDAGVNVWYDEGILPGSEWTQQLADAIEGSIQFLYFVSPSSVASRNCRNEVQLALDHDATLVSVYLEPTEMPGGMKLTLGLAQAVMKYQLTAKDYARKMSDALSISPTLKEGATNASPAFRSWKLPWLIAGCVTVALLATTAYWWNRQIASPPPPGAKQIVETARATSIAVLPFTNMSSDPEQEYFSDGMSEELLNLLARNSDLKVISRSSAFSFKGKDVDMPTLVAKLGVSHILEGSVRKSGDTIRITAQLIDALNDSHLWSQTYDRKLDDVFAVQDEIAANIVSVLNATLTGRAPTARVSNPEAYMLFLQARHILGLGNFSVEEFSRAQALLEQALELDPNYVRALTELARLYGQQGSAGALSYGDRVLMSD